MRRTQVAAVMVFGALILVGTTSVASAQISDPGPGSRGETVEITLSTPDGTSSPVVSNRFDFSSVASRIRWNAWDYQRFLPAEGALPRLRAIQSYLRRQFGM